jgi:hypothetical protein
VRSTVNKPVVADDVKATFVPSFSGTSATTTSTSRGGFVVWVDGVVAWDDVVLDVDDGFEVAVWGGLVVEGVDGSGAPGVTGVCCWAGGCVSCSGGASVARGLEGAV